MRSAPTTLDRAFARRQAKGFATMTKQEDADDRAMLALRRLNQTVSNPPVFLALAQAFEDFSRSAADRSEGSYLMTLSTSCRRRNDEQKARSDLSPSWDREASGKR